MQFITEVEYPIKYENTKTRTTGSKVSLELNRLLKQTLLATDPHTLLEPSYYEQTHSWYLGTHNQFRFDVSTGSNITVMAPDPYF